jgi:mono/diheme cytochrome c family protein
MKKFLLAVVTMVFTFSLASVAAPTAQKGWDIPAKYKAMKNKNKGNQASIKLGKDLFTKNCKSCHGAAGKGDGPRAASLKTKMPDLTAQSFKSLSDGEKYYMSIVGKGEMPNFEKKIPDEDERWAIISYLDTL